MATRTTKSTAKTATRTTKTAKIVDQSTPALTPNTVDQSTLTHHFGYPVVNFQEISLKQFVETYDLTSNVRSKANETADDPELQNSIKEVGVKNPLVVSKDKILLDGFRRLHYARLVDESGSSMVPVITIDIAQSEIALFQYITGIEKGHTQEEKALAIIKYAENNPNMSDAQIANKFGLHKTGVSDLTRIVRCTPNLTPYYLSREISKNAALSVIEAAQKQKVEPEQVAEKLLEKLREDKKIGDTPDNTKKGLSRKVTDSYLGEILPKFSPEQVENKTKITGQTQPSPKKLLEDLYRQIRFDGNPKDNIQLFFGEVHTDFIAQIELLLYGSPTPATKSVLDTYTINSQTVECSTEHVHELYRVYLGLEVGDADICLATTNYWVFCEEAASTWQKIVGEYSNSHEVKNISGVNWLMVYKSVFSQNHIIEFAQKHRISLEIVNIQVPNMYIQEDVDTPDSVEVEEEIDDDDVTSMLKPQERIIDIEEMELDEDDMDDDDDSFL